MPVDEYSVTIRTRGQYPAAPPTKTPNFRQECWVFSLLKVTFTKKNNHLRVVVVLEVEFFEFFFVFGSRKVLDNFFIQKLPL